MTKRKLINLGLILLIISSCAFVGIKSFYSVKVAQLSNAELARFQLPLFEKIQSLRSVLAMQNLVFHNYYLSSDDETFLAEFSKRQFDVTKLVSHINDDFGQNDTLQNLMVETSRINDVAERMNLVMKAPTDWDGARAVLAQLEPITASMNQLIGTLITDIEKKVVTQAGQTLAQIEQSLLWTSLLNGGLLLTLGMLLWLDAKRNRDQNEIRRFAGFPERNPRPVLALTATGEINYANPASETLCQSLFNSKDLNKLLPDEVEHLIAQCNNEEDYFEGEYCLGDRHYDYVLQRLPDLNEFRLYLADISARKMAENNLRRLAYYDELTGLNNKAALNRDFIAESTHSCGFILLIDIITLSQVTLRLGHSSMDTAIKLCANQINDVCHFYNARLYHLSDERFAIRLESDEDSVFHSLLDALNASFSKSMNINGLEFFLTLALGGTGYNRDADFDTVLKEANIAMRSVAERGGFAAYTDQLETQSKWKMNIEVALRGAIAKNQFTLYFQPQLNLKTNRITGAEALLRWQDDSGEWISPADFIPIAEESDLIIEIGNWVLRQAIQTTTEFVDHALACPFVIAINIAPEQLLSPGFSQHVSTLLAEYNVPAESVELEITESAALYDINLAISVMRQLQEKGIRLAMDDFGTGYSSFSYITQLPLNKLKIDQSFIRNMLSDTKLCKVTETMIAMASPLSLTVIAEGVESGEHLNILKRWGCDEVQGYHIARPMPLAELKLWLKKTAKNYSALIQ